jgi:solute carrier family 25 (mitochondrial S-adenosylmethionine transporter), member 26
MSYIVTGGLVFIILLLVAHHVSSSAVASSLINQKPSFRSLSSIFLSSSASSTTSKTTTSTLIVDQIGRGGDSSKNQRNNAHTKSSSLSSSLITKLGGPFRVFVQTIQNGRRHLIAAAIARTTSIFIMYPVDAIKTRLQLKQLNPFRMTGLLNGVGGSLMGQVPYGVLTFGSYEMYKTALLSKFPNTKPIWLYAMAAIMGDMTGSGWICPSEVVKQQVQAGMYPTTSAAISSIWNQKGISGFYQGYLGGISRDVPFRVAQLTTFEITKSLFLKLKRQRATTAALTERNKNNKNKRTTPPQIPNVELTPIEAALCGAVSGSFSAAITSPLDRFKTLLMTNSQLYGGSVLSCATKIWNEEGIAGITTGMIPRVVYIAPSVVIFFVVYEMSQQKLKKYFVTESVKNTN